MPGVEPHPYILGQLLSIGMLIAATIEYAEILKRRCATRAFVAECADSRVKALQGLVRVFLADPVPTRPNLRVARWGR